MVKTNAKNQPFQITVYTDGASRGNPGLAGAGVVIQFLKLKHNLAVFLGKKTNNEAEYSAFLIALRYIIRLLNESEEKQQLNVSKVVFRSDSKLVVKQVNREWKIKNERMQKYVSQAHQLIQQIPCPVEITYVDRAKNESADWLANQAIELRQ